MTIPRNIVWLFCGILIDATFACIVYEARLGYIRYPALQLIFKGVER